MGTFSTDLEDATYKVPPHNIEAEQSVLGAILIENSALYKAIELVSANDFYKEAHRRIFLSMLELCEKNEAIDLVTLTEYLRKKNELESIGGATYLSFLSNTVPTAANIRYHSKIVREKALLRNLISTATEIVTRGYEDSQDIEELLDYAENAIFSISEKKIRPSFIAIKDILMNSFETIERLSEKKELITGVSTGFDKLDTLTSGFQPSDLIIVAGRPSMGKTAFCLCIAQHAGIKKRQPVAIFSLEMAKEQLVMRMLCAEARVDSHKLRSGFLSKSDWPKLRMAAERLSEALIFIDDTPGTSVLEMKAKARRLKAEHDLGLIIVDYLQLMSGRADRRRGGADTREQEISEISRSLKALAKELSVPVVALSQLNRAVESRHDKRPMLADLRECVTGGTLVVLADGQRISIRELVGQKTRVVSLAENGRLVEAEAEKVWCVGRRPVFEVRLASGRIIRATREHRLLGARGWCKVSDFKIGDRVAIARVLPQPVETDIWPETRVVLLGHLIGDGSYLTGQPMRYTTSSEENSRVVAEAAQKEFGAKVTRYRGKGSWHQLVISGNGNRWHPEGINLWFRELGIFGQRSHEKRIPRSVFRLSNEQISLLLRHLWATEGTISMRTHGDRGDHSIHFSTCSRGLAEDISSLLLRFGIVARIQTVQAKGHRPTYMVWIRGVEAQSLFLAKVGAFGPRSLQAERLAEALSGVIANTNVDTLPKEFFERVRLLMKEAGISQRRMAALRGTSYGGSSHFRFSPSRQMLNEYAKILDDDMLRRQSEGDLFWDRLVSIEPIGEEEVYDLTVPGTASWLADGIISHNSGAIEQDADVILFIFREEVYKPTEENKGIAEIIIGKQRNGPVGTVELAFIDKYTRFENLDKMHGEYSG